MAESWHRWVLEGRAGLFAILATVGISVGGLVEILPMYTVKTEPLPGVTPYSPLEVAGRDIYVREGCYNCHSQMIRPLRGETERYGHYSLAGEAVYDHPFQFGSKRTGPDLARVGGRYSDEWHRRHLLNPRDLVPESNMPGYPWLENQVIDANRTGAKMKALRVLGVPYTDEQIAGAADEVQNRNEMDALVAYLQGLGTASQNWK